MKRLNILFVILASLFIGACQSEETKVDSSMKITEEYQHEIDLIIKENPHYLRQLTNELNKWNTAEANIYSKEYQEKFMDIIQEYNNFLSTFKMSPTTKTEEEIDVYMKKSIAAQEEANHALLNYILRKDIDQLDIADQKMKESTEAYNNFIDLSEDLNQ